MNNLGRRNLIILSAALVIVTLGFGMVVPLFPFLVEDMGGSGVELGLLVAIAAFMELVFGPVWGGLSDRFGRKPIMLIGLVGYALASLLFGLSTELWMLFASRALSGILSSATASTAMAYIGDITSEEDRGGGMGILGAASGLGIIIGPGFGGWLGDVHLSLPFFVSAGLSIITLLFALFLLPESLPIEARKMGKQTKKENGLRTLRRALVGPLGILLFLLFMASFGLANFEAVFGLYALEKFGFGPGEVGTILTVVGVVSTAGKIFTGALTRRWGDPAVMKVSLLAGSGGFLVLLAANTNLTLLLATGVFVLSKTFLRPSLLSLISKRTVFGQGTSMGWSNSFMNLGRIIGPIWAGFIFDVNLSYPYLSGSIVLLIGFVISLLAVAPEVPAEMEATEL